MAFRKWISAHHPRDGKGRFARKGGGGSSSKRAPAKRTPAQKRTRSLQRKRTRNAAIIGGALGFFGSLGNPVVAIAGAGVGAAVVRRKRKKR